MIGFLVTLGFGTMFVLLVMHLMKRTKTERTKTERTETDGVNIVGQDKFKKFVHDKKDKTDKAKAIHRRAGKSEYWARHDMDQGLYA